MIHLLQRAKHWHLFLITTILPIIFQFIFMGIMFSNILQSGNPDPLQMMGIMKYMMLIILLIQSVHYMWFWAITIGLKDKLPAGVKFNTTRFKVFFFFPAAYFFIFILIFFSAFDLFMESALTNKAPDLDGFFFYYPLFFGLFFLSHLFSIFCIIHTLYWSAKVIKSVETQKEASFSDFAAEFFLIWFYPVGVWFIQPKVNSFVLEELKEEV